MDRQHREGGKTGSGFLTQADQHAHRRQRLLSLAMETADLAKDPYLIRNHLGQYECVLCMTVHTNEGSYLAHTQAKRHQTNLGRRAAKEAALAAKQEGASAGGMISKMVQGQAAASKPQVPRCGRPKFVLKKLSDPESGAKGVLLLLHFPRARSAPRYRVMSAFEQRLEAPNRSYQYLLVGCEPYETLAFKMPNRELAAGPEGGTFEYWDSDYSVYTIQVMYSGGQ